MLMCKTADKTFNKKGKVKCCCKTDRNFHYTILHDTELSSFVYLLHTRFHFHMGAGNAGNLSMILQKGEEDRKLLWSRSISTSTQWVPEHLPLGKQDQPYRVCQCQCVWDAKHLHMQSWVWSLEINPVGSLPHTLIQASFLHDYRHIFPLSHLRSLSAAKPNSDRMITCLQLGSWPWMISPSIIVRKTTNQGRPWHR